MNLCFDGHEEICYDAKHCPMCILMDEYKDRERDIDSLRVELDNLRQEISKQES